MAGAREESELWSALRKTQLQVSSWEEMMCWLQGIRNDNGHEGLETRLNTLEAFMASRRRIEWAAILALIAVLVGAAFNVGSYVTIAGIKATIQQQVHPAGGENSAAARGGG